MGIKKQIIYSVDEVPAVAQQLAEQLKLVSVMTFTGTLGAGKTTLVHELLKASGVNEAVTSPTFNYMNVYKNGQGRMFYHFDLYRIASIDSFVEAGFNEYLYQPNSAALIEWPSVVMDLITHDVCHVVLEYHDDLSKRVLTFECK